MLDSGDSLQHCCPVQGSWFRPRIPSQPSTRRPARRTRLLHLRPRRTQVRASPSLCHVAHLPSVSLGAVVDLASSCRHRACESWCGPYSLQHSGRRPVQGSRIPSQLFYSVCLSLWKQRIVTCCTPVGVIRTVYERCCTPVSVPRTVCERCCTYVIVAPGRTFYASERCFTLVVHPWSSAALLMSAVVHPWASPALL
jgi:hypothetical protein